MERAYARIEKGVVRLGNAWLERRWSSFLGTTTELRRNPGGEECLSQRSPEFHIDYGSRPLAAMDLGDLSWSDGTDAHGAWITLDLQGPGVAVSLETLFFHRVPGQVRTLSITNTGGEIVVITRAAAEILPLNPDAFRARSVQGEAEASLTALGEPIHYTALRGAGGAFLLGACRRARFALYHPHPAYCAPVWEGSVSLEPGKTWQAPPAVLYWSGSGGGTDLAGELNGFHRIWEARQLGLDAFHPSRN